MKTKGRSHNEKILKLMVERNKTLTEEESVFKIINKLFNESNNILNDRLKAIDKIEQKINNMEKMFKHLKPIIDKMNVYESRH